MLWLCSKDHDEICFDGDSQSHCPVCALVDEHTDKVEELEDKITGLEDELRLAKGD